jgi:hypothetical protein
VSGTINITGAAAKGDKPLDRVEVSIDGSKWKKATGLQSWYLNLDTWTLTNGFHNITARALGGQLYSENVTIQVVVSNSGTPPPPPTTPGSDLTTTDQFPWPTLLAILLVAGLVSYLYLRGRGPRRPGER